MFNLVPSPPHTPRQGNGAPQKPHIAVAPEPIADPASTLLLDTSPPEPWSVLAQDVLDDLPPVWSRGLLYGLLGCMAMVLPWAIFASVDETGTARGRLELRGTTVQKDLDLPTAATVTALHATAGDRVKAGQVLVEFDGRSIREELQQLQTKLSGQQAQQTQLTLLRHQLLGEVNAQTQQNLSQQLEKETQVSQAQQALSTLTTNMTQQRAETLAPLTQAQQAVTGSQRTYDLARDRLQSMEAEVQRYQQLQVAGVVPLVKLKEIQSEARESSRLQSQAATELSQSRLRVAEHQARAATRMNQLSADIQQAKLRLQEQQRGYQTLQHGSDLALSKSQQQLSDLERQHHTLETDLRQTQAQIATLTRRLGQYQVRSPFAGLLVQFPIQKVGTVVQPGQPIAQLAKQGTQLIFKAQIASQESGFLRVGLPVKLKFDAYPFQDYGVVAGRLTWIAPDSRPLETPQGIQEVFDLEVQPQSLFLQTSTQKIPLLTGQTATAEVVVRQRRVIDFILDPFRQLQKGGAKL